MTLSHNALIIGAGAHCPYGMPSGAKLKSSILDTVLKGGRGYSGLISNVNLWENHKYRLVKAIHQYYAHAYSLEGNPANDFSEVEINNLVNSFVDDFQRSGIYSIDRFLTAVNKVKEYKFNSYYETIGKIFILYFINHYQTQSQINPQEDWIEYLINSFLLNANDKLEALSNFPKIITFNYDTLFEHKVRSHLEVVLGKPKEELNEIMTKLEIIHVYGETTLFDKDIDKIRSPRIDSAINKLFVISETRNQKEKHFDSARTIIGQSPKIYFLGFGFDQQNMEVLFEKHPWGQSSHRYHYTLKGLGNSELKGLNDFTKGNIRKIRDANNHSEDCLELIKEKVSLDSK